MKHSVPTRRATDLSLSERHPCAVAPERHRSSSPCECTYRPFAVPTGYCAPARRPYGQNRPENHIGRTPRYKPSCSVQDVPFPNHGPERSEEHTSELQSIMRISYAVLCLKNK